MNDKIRALYPTNMSPKQYIKRYKQQKWTLKKLLDRQLLKKIHNCNLFQSSRTLSIHTFCNSCVIYAYYLSTYQLVFRFPQLGDISHCLHGPFNTKGKSTRKRSNVRKYDCISVPRSCSALSIEFNCRNTKPNKSSEQRLFHVGKLLERHILYHRR